MFSDESASGLDQLEGINLFVFLFLFFALDHVFIKDGVFHPNSSIFSLYRGKSRVRDASSKPMIFWAI